MSVSCSSPRRAAFTLLELAIVITIIGLLTGGIVTGRNYIRAAELNTMLTDAKTYMSAFASFQDRYRAIPGDFATASSIWSGASNGDGNGLIRAGTSNTAEMFVAFRHLALAGLIEGVYDSGGTTASAGFNIPRAVVDQVAYQFDHPDAADGGVASDSYYFDGYYGHVLYAGRVAPSGATRPSNGFMTPEEALSLDTKFDDGLPGMGAMLTPKSTALTGCASSDVAASATYSNTATTKSCLFILKLP